MNADLVLKDITVNLNNNDVAYKVAKAYIESFKSTYNIDKMSPVNKRIFYLGSTLSIERHEFENGMSWYKQSGRLTKEQVSNFVEGLMKVRAFDQAWHAMALARTYGVRTLDITTIQFIKNTPYTWQAILASKFLSKNSRGGVYLYFISKEINNKHYNKMIKELFGKEINIPLTQIYEHPTLLIQMFNNTPPKYTSYLVLSLLRYFFTNSETEFIELIEQLHSHHFSFRIPSNYTPFFRHGFQNRWVIATEKLYNIYDKSDPEINIRILIQRRGLKEAVDYIIKEQVKNPFLCESILREIKTTSKELPIVCETIDNLLMYMESKNIRPTQRSCNEIFRIYLQLDIQKAFEFVQKFGIDDLTLSLVAEKTTDINVIYLLMQYARKNTIVNYPFYFHCFKKIINQEKYVDAWLLHLQIHPIDLHNHASLGCSKVMIKMLIGNKKLNDAKLYFIRAKKTSPKVAYETMLSSLAKHGFIEEYFVYLKNMTEENFPYTQKIYETTFSACISVGDLELAIKFWEQMKENKVMPSVNSLKALLMCCAEVFNFEFGEKLVEEIIMMNKRKELDVELLKYQSVQVLANRNKNI